MVSAKMPGIFRSIALASGMGFSVNPVGLLASRSKLRSLPMRAAFSMTITAAKPFGASSLSIADVVGTVCSDVRGLAMS